MAECHQRQRELVSVTHKQTITQKFSSHVVSSWPVERMETIYGIMSISLPKEHILSTC